MNTDWSALRSAQLLTGEDVEKSECAYLIDKVYPDELLVISFGFVSWVEPPKFDFFGRLKKMEVLGARPINKILIKDRQNAWYHRGIDGLGTHADEVTETLRKIIEAISPNRVITIGQSMGGYAAVMYGALLKVDAILAFGPLSFLNVEQAKLYHEKRWLGVMEALEAAPPVSGYYDLPQLCSAQNPSQTQLNIIFGTKPDGDESIESVNLDAMHAQRFTKHLNCRLFPYPRS